MTSTTAAPTPIERAREAEPGQDVLAEKDVGGIVAERRREAAARANAEAQARRLQSEGRAAPKPIEKGGRQGLDPVRYGDWEVGGIATDF
jgi:hypothetical protein